MGADLLAWPISTATSPGLGSVGSSTASGLYLRAGWETGDNCNTQNLEIESEGSGTQARNGVQSGTWVLLGDSKCGCCRQDNEKVLVNLPVPPPF